MIKEFVKDVQDNKIDIKEYSAKALEEAKRIDGEYHYFNFIVDDVAIQANRALSRKSGPLAGLPVSVKDCICVKDMPSQAGSAILQGYKPFFDATAVAKVREAGAIILGKTSQDEFGFGTFNINVGKGFNIPKNPHDKERVTGGSSGGAAGITALSKHVHGAIAESTGGSIESPAAFCGVVGFCPTYGVVSRFGLIDYGNSFDKIGVMGKTVDDAEYLFKVIAGHDTLDSTSSRRVIEWSSTPKHKRIAVLSFDSDKTSFGGSKGSALDPSALNKDIENALHNCVEMFRSNKITVESISLPINMKYGVAAYYILALAEASTNLAKYCGLRYGASTQLQGKFDDYFSMVRSEFFGEEAKRRIMLGTFTRMAGFRDAYYIKAAKIRTLIIEEYLNVFDKYDAILSPTMPIVAPTISEVKKLSPAENYLMDILTIGPNLAGLPHVSIPFGKSKGLPIGLMLTAGHFNDPILFNLAKMTEER